MLLLLIHDTCREKEKEKDFRFSFEMYAEIVLILIVCWQNMNNFYFPRNSVCVRDVRKGEISTKVDVEKR